MCCFCGALQLPVPGSLTCCKHALTGCHQFNLLHCVCLFLAAAWLLLQLPVPGSVASLQMTPQGVVRSFYPLKGNEAALNHNLFRGAAHYMRLVVILFS